MAARIEVFDFINAEKKTGPTLTIEKVTENALHIVEIYSKREADEITLQNDLFDLVNSCRQAERNGAKKYVIGDYEIAITMLLQSATDWHVFLPKNEIKRYEGVRLDNIVNLATYIRRLYQDKQDDKSIYDYMIGDDIETRLTGAHKVKGKGYDPVRRILTILFPEKVPKLPPLKVFNGEFGDRIKRSGYSDICKEIKDSWKEKKKPNKLD